MINPNIAGVDYLYSYNMTGRPDWFLFDGVKHDVRTGREERHSFGDGVFGSETPFAPRPNATAEDDGYLVTFTTDTNRDRSECLIFDAANLTDGPVARVRLATLVDAGVLRRVDGSYALDEAGRDLWQVLLCIWDWESRHVAGQSTRLPQMVHATCGVAFHRCCAAAGATPSPPTTTSTPASAQRQLRTVGAGRQQPSPGRGHPVVDARAGHVRRHDGHHRSRWSSAVLGAAFLGATRFRDFEQIGAPPAIADCAHPSEIGKVQISGESRFNW